MEGNSSPTTSAKNNVNYQDEGRGLSGTDQAFFKPV
jgi:hypothetical protein